MKAKSNFVVCIRRLREPNDDDIKNLNFKRGNRGSGASDPIEEEPLEDDNAGDGLMRDLELDMMGEISDDEDEFDADGRIAPQWTPDRVLANLVFDVVEASGTDGIDGAKLRDFTTGIFWKRPVESLVTRLTEDWYETQPLHIRHLAIVRDTTIARNMKRVHYAYRTHQNFQKAVDAGQMSWEALNLDKNKGKKRAPPPASSVDRLGFSTLNAKDFHKSTGAATVSEVSAGIVRKHRQGRDWESIIFDRERSATSKRKSPDISEPPSGQEKRAKKIRKTDSKIPRPLLNQAERIALGLPLKGRLGVHFESQIRAHRKKTGDPNSIPEKLYKGLLVDELEDKPKPRYERRPGPPLLTREERKARGLPEHGRLSFKVTEQILKEQGRKEPLSHMKMLDEAVDAENHSSDSNTPGRSEILDQSKTQEPSRTKIAAVNGGSVRAADVSNDINNLPGDRSARSPAASQTLEHAISDSALRKKRTYQDLPIEEDVSLAGRPEKRTKISSSKFSASSTIQSDNSTGVKTPIINPAKHAEPGRKTTETPAVMEIPKASQWSHVNRLPSASVGDEIGADIDSTNAVSQSMRMSTKGSTEPRKNGVKQKLQPPQIDAGALAFARVCRAQLGKRTTPGLYVNSKATMSPKGGRGRPKKVFLATFKLPGLHDLDWFVSDDPDTQDPIILPSSSENRSKALVEASAPVIEKNVTASLAPDVTTTSVPASRGEEEKQDQIEVDVPMEDIGPRSGTEQPEPESAFNTTSIETGTAMEIDTSSNAIDGHSATKDQLDDLIDKPAQVTSQPSQVGDVVEAMSPSAVVLDVSSSAEKAATDSTNTGPSSGQNAPVTPRLPSSTDIANSQHSTAHQSPYATTNSETPPCNATNEAYAVSTTNVDHHMSASQTLPYYIDEEASSPQTSTEPSQRMKDRRRTLRGGGNVAQTRLNVIRHVLDLCGGMIPGMYAMYATFPSVWAEFAPKMPCPIQGTIRESVEALCTSILSKATFRIPRTDIPGKKLKTVYFYSHFTLASPEVQKMVNTFIEVLPEKYCPPELQRYWKDEERPISVIPKVNNSYIEEVYPATSKILDQRIIAAKTARRDAAKAAAKAKKEEKRQRMKQAKIEAKKLAMELKRDGKSSQGPVHHQKLLKKRERLVSLQDGQRTVEDYLGRSLMRGPGVSPQQHGEGTGATESPEEEPLSNIRPRLQGQSGHFKALMAPTIRLHPLTHTFSTNFAVETPTSVLEPGKQSRKRARTEQPVDENARKKSRPETAEDFLVRHGIVIDESSDEDNEEVGPSIAHRVAGLTGDLDEPDFVPRERDRRSEPGARRLRKDRKRRTYRELQEAKAEKLLSTLDRVGEFKKLCYTLIIASSMVGEDGSVDWDLVAKVYKEDRYFDLKKMKNTWAWVQKRMTEQLQSMTESFQSQFLSAYEKGEVEPIENPDTYDWTNLVRWACETCAYIEPLLPLAFETPSDTTFEISSYNILDRKAWYNTAIASCNREERLARYSFGGPLNGKRNRVPPEDDNNLIARSLIRATISTPQELYDKRVAYSKLKEIPEPVINRTVRDFLQAGLIKERKAKRQVPGRNYIFSSRFAKHYRRTLEASDFMTAASLKKDLDASIADPDPAKHPFLVSRAAENGTVMALISLASEGKIKLVPKLPLINNEFGAPLPKLSLWGFAECDYRHRLMDRERLFWPLEAVPTDTYEYGNPLRPSFSTPALNEDGGTTVWNPMPSPPMPARDSDSKSLLPIWSTLDGQTIIYPWWNRILNVVVQTLALSPGLTARSALARCETYSIEEFEIQLVLDWLVSVGAAKKLSHGTYEALLSYWAVFGDELIDEEKDSFGHHVRRPKRDMTIGNNWRIAVNREYYFAQKQKQAEAAAQGNGAGPSAPKEILNDPRKQYTIAKQVIAGPASGTPMEDVQMTGVTETQDQGQNQAQSEPQTRTESRAQSEVQPSQPSTVSTPAFTPADTAASTPRDIEMTDSDMDADGESDDEYM